MAMCGSPGQSSGERVESDTSVACFIRETKKISQVFHLTPFLNFFRAGCRALFRYNFGMQRRLIGILLGILVLCFSLVLLAWGLWPARLQERVISLTAAEVMGDLSGTGEAQSDVDGRRLSFVWPGRMRLGDMEQVRIDLEALEPEATASAGAESSGEAASTAALVSRLELSGLTVSPQGEYIEGLQPGKPVRFFWDVSSPESGAYRGKAWLYFSPLSPDEAQPRLVSAQEFEIQVQDLLGLSGRAARILGSLGAALGLVLILGSLLSAVPAAPEQHAPSEEKKNA